jgi:NAD(P)-dependent dehydrogenase (short-subunit alcohol dehydrogenase family)
VVTGGTSGIAAERLAAEGAHVFVTGRDKQRLDEAIASIGASATGIRADVTDPDDVDRVAEAVKVHGHGLDVAFTKSGGGALAPTRAG